MALWHDMLGWMSPKEAAVAAHSLRAMAEAGMPTTRSLQVLVRDSRGPGRAIWRRVLHRVADEGVPLGAAARAERGMPRLLGQMLDAGEATGRLAHMAGVAAEYYDRRRRLSVGAWRALMPIVALLAVGGAAVGGLGMVLGGGFSLRGLLATLSMVLGPLLVLAVVWLVLQAVPVLRRARDRILLRVPMLGPALLELNEAQFALVLGAANDAGLPSVEAVAMAYAAMGNAFLRRGAPEAVRTVAARGTMAEALEAGGMPRELVAAVAAAEASGTLPGTLSALGQRAGESAEHGLKVFQELVVRVAWLCVIVWLAVHVAGRSGAITHAD